MRSLFIFIYTTILSLSLQAEVLRVRVMADTRQNSVIVTFIAGGYQLFADNSLLRITDPQTAFICIAYNDSVILKTIEHDLGKFKKIRFNAISQTNTLQLKPVTPAGKIRFYEDGLEVVSKNKELQLINIVEIENYIGGVIESEAGTKAPLEYNKVQAILCRTYALSHLRRHEEESFNLCDLVHCQVYKNKTIKPNILTAVINTKGLVIVDADLNLATTAFHSNCGGQTLNSEDVWSLPKPYLKSVKDTFCLNQPHAKWQRKVSLADWNTYLELKETGTLKGAPDTLLVNGMSNNYGRDVFYKYNNIQIPLKEIRTDWKLKSCYFKIEQKSDTLMFIGRGYGHGVGLCQEGAMNMAKQGISYSDIIHYYFKDVHLVDLKVLDFFRQE